MAKLSDGGGTPLHDEHVIREEHRHFHRLGWTDLEIAKRLGYRNADSLHHAMRRAGIEPQPAQEVPA